MPAPLQTPEAARVARRAYLVNEFCAAMRVSRDTTYKLMRDGKLPFFYIGGRRHIPADAVEALLRGDGDLGQMQPKPVRRRKGAAA